MIKNKKLIKKNEGIFRQLEHISFHILKSTQLSLGNAHLRKSLLSLLSLLIFSYFPQPSNFDHQNCNIDQQKDIIFDDRENERIEEFIRLVSDYAKTDPDPRVRKTAFDSLLSLHYQTTYNLDIDLYKITVEALNDDFEEVRLQAIEVCFILFVLLLLKDKF